MSVGGKVLVFIDEKDLGNVTYFHWEELDVYARRILEQARLAGSVIIKKDLGGREDGTKVLWKTMVGRMFGGKDPLEERPMKKYRVELSALARMSGTAEVEAKDEAFAKLAIWDRIGDIQWSYEGIVEGMASGEPVEVVGIHEVSS